MKNALKRMRIKAKLTQKQAADALGVSQSTISMWETGAALPRTELLERIATVYGCGIGDLFQNEAS